MKTNHRCIITAYNSKQEAEFDMAIINKIDNKQLAFDPYLCECGKWHFHRSREMAFCVEYLKNKIDNMKPIAVTKQLLNDIEPHVDKDTFELIMSIASDRFQNGYFDYSLDKSGIVFILKNKKNGNN
jgi:hypothetical protein